MTRIVNITDIFISPDDTSQAGVLTAQRALLVHVIPPPPNWRVLDAQVKLVAYTGDPETMRSAEVTGTVNTGKLEEDIDSLLVSFADALVPLYENGNPDRVTVIVEVIEED